MTSKTGAKAKDIDPEILMKRKFRAKCLFRALGRLVMANTYWLIECIDHYEGVDDVKRRVEQAVRSKAKKKDLLNIHDKAILNKPAEERTDQEKQYLYRIIGGLKCFKRYPNNVKRKLAAVTYFQYYGPGRTIVRQHHEAHALYFVVTGDVIISQMIYDELLQQYISVDVGVMHPGDMFGEVSLLHNIPRTATCTTVGHCELLQLMKEDFKNVLQASVQKQWDEVRRAMSAFIYFDALDEVARREGCIVAKMKSYAVNETILGDGVGVPNFVYFILNGRCQMIESLQVTVTTRLGRTFYTLYDPYVPEEESEQDFDTKYFGHYKDLNKDKTRSSISEVSKHNNEVKEDGSIRPSSSERPSILKKPSASTENQRSSLKKESVQITEPSSKKDSVSSNERRKSSNLIMPVSSRTASKSSIRMSVLQEGGRSGSHGSPPNLRTYFMQVCQFNPGSSFGFGENMRDRRVIALTPVDCMLLPMIWLLQRNTANIWTRIQHYLEKKIPNKKQLFEEFVSARRWEEFREQLVDDVISRSNTVNWTSVHDVPYSIRIDEMLDI